MKYEIVSSMPPTDSVIVSTQAMRPGEIGEIVEGGLAGQHVLRTTDDQILLENPKMAAIHAQVRVFVVGAEIHLKRIE